MLQPINRIRRSSTFYKVLKKLIDRVSALVLLVPGLPIIGVLVLLVRATSRGPGIFRQVRVGQGGKTFVMYKIRTMRIDAETAQTGAVWAKENDPRTTRLGLWLRQKHLDELPQLFNVLKGEMSLVGPRPERPEFVKILAECIPGYAERLNVAPGITGWAQINLPPDENLASVDRKLFVDRAYIQNMSFLLDVKILFSTAGKLVGINGLWLASALNLLIDVPQIPVDYYAADTLFVPHELGATTRPADDAPISESRNNCSQGSIALSSTNLLG